MTRWNKCWKLSTHTYRWHWVALSRLSVLVFAGEIAQSDRVHRWGVEPVGGSREDWMLITPVVVTVSILWLQVLKVLLFFFPPNSFSLSHLSLNAKSQNCLPEKFQSTLNHFSDSDTEIRLCLLIINAMMGIMRQAYSWCAGSLGLCIVLMVSTKWAIYMLEVYFSSRSIVYLSRLTHTSVYCICKCVCMDAEGWADCLPVDVRGRTAGLWVNAERQREWRLKRRWCLL